MRWADTRRTSNRDGVLEEAFDAAFRALDPGHARRTPLEWEWRTERVPGSAPFVTLRDEAGEVLAHYGALGQSVRVHGQLLRAGQAVDTFAGAQLAPRARAAAFQAACEAFMEEHCGVGEEHDLRPTTEHRIRRPLRVLLRVPRAPGLAPGARGPGLQRPAGVPPADAPGCGGRNGPLGPRPRPRRALAGGS